MSHKRYRKVAKILLQYLTILVSNPSNPPFGFKEEKVQKKGWILDDISCSLGGVACLPLSLV